MNITAKSCLLDTVVSYPLIRLLKINLLNCFLPTELCRKEDWLEIVFISIEYEFRMLQLEKENTMGMLRVYARDKLDLEDTIRHLTDERTFAQQRNHILERKIMELESKLAKETKGSEIGQKR